MTANKADLRQRLKQARLELSPADRAARSQAIIKQLKASIDWSAVGTLHYFKSLKKFNEVDLTDFIKSLQTDHPKLKIYTSTKTDGVWQIPDIKFDVIIVPMLGFDPKTLHRIGYGGGYYDRFLAAQPQAQKIGVCFEQGKLDHLPAEQHDISLDMVITEQALIRRTKQ